MPSSISKARLRKAFNEGRRSATSQAMENPHDNPKLRQLWEQGRAMQRSGEVKTPIPPLDHGEARAQRATRNPLRAKPSAPPHGTCLVSERIASAGDDSFWLFGLPLDRFG